MNFIFCLAGFVLLVIIYYYILYKIAELKAFVRKYPLILIVSFSIYISSYTCMLIFLLKEIIVIEHLLIVNSLFIVIVGFVSGIIFFKFNILRNLLFNSLFLSISLVSKVIFNIIVSTFNQNIILSLNNYKLIGNYVFTVSFIVIVILALVSKYFEKFYFKMVIIERFLYSIMILICLIATFVLEGIYIHYKTENNSINIIPIIIICSLITVFIIAVDKYIINNNKVNESLKIKSAVENQITYYKSIEENQGEVYKMYHDLKNHLLTISSMQNKHTVSESNMENDYIDKCLSKVKEIESLFKTGNSYVDVMLNDKWNKAVSKGISPEFYVPENTLDGIEIFDITVLLGNSLDNAIEAAGKLAEINEKGFLTLKVVKKGNMVMIKVTNNYLQKPIMKNGELKTIKENKKSHGIGIKNMKEVVAKYNGSLSTKFNNEKFEISIIVFIKY